MDAQAELRKLAGFEVRNDSDRILRIYEGDRRISADGYVSILWNISLKLLREKEEAERKGWNVESTIKAIRGSAFYTLPEDKDIVYLNLTRLEVELSQLKDSLKPKEATQ